MKNFVLLIIAAITICGATMFTSCSLVDNPATQQALAFSFDGKTLKHTDGDKVTILVSATTEQIQTYQMLSDEWHGGSAGAIDLSTL